MPALALHTIWGSTLSTERQAGLYRSRSVPLQPLADQGPTVHILKHPAGKNHDAKRCEQLIMQLQTQRSAGRLRS